MMHLLAGFFLTLAFLGAGGCVVYDPGYHGYPRYHSPRYYYQGPPIFFRFHYHHGRHHGLNQEYSPMEPVFLVNYGGEPFMCVDDAGPDKG